MKFKKSTDPLENAFFDYYGGNEHAEIIVHSNKSDTEVVPVAYFFREYNNMPQLEQKAMALCSGEILDVGAGSGSHTLFLQQNGKSSTALEIKAGLAELMQKRGIQKVINSDIYNYRALKYDTLLLLMNGIGFTGDFNGLQEFLQHAKSLLNPGGQIILDSSDILYLYEQEDGAYMINLNEEYYGEVEYQFEYQGIIGERFKWLFVDFNSLLQYAMQEGFECEMVYEDEHFNYLAVLSLIG